MVLFGWIFILLLHVTGVEVFEFPPESARGALFRASAASGIVDALNGLACVVASAVVVALAYPLIIPMSVVLDFWWNGHSIRSWGAFGWIGTVIVIAGVFCLEANPPPPQDENENPRVEKGESGVEDSGGCQELQEYSMSPSAPITADYVSIT
jgi:drug/metabolite transporter (DMT)-like permease